MKPTLLMAVIGLAIGGLVGYHTVYVPQKGHARLIDIQATQVQADHRAQQEVAALLQQIAQFQKRLPPEPDPSWLVRKVVELGRGAGVVFSMIAQESPQDNQDFTRLAVTLQFTSTYHQLGMFLDTLERSEDFIRVDSLDISAPRETEKDAAIRLTLSTVYFPPVLTVPHATKSHAARGKK